jgi:hypothetical protein
MSRQFAGFFDSIEGDERSYVAEEFAQYFRAFFSDGVTALGENLQVTALGTSMQVTVSPGIGAIQGYFYGLFDDGGDPLQLVVSAPGAQTRIARIVLRLDRTTDVRSILPAVLKGSSSSAPPALTQNSDLWEISLAQIDVRPGVSVIEQADITDERADNGICGVIEPYSVKQYINQGVKTTDTPTFAGINAPHTQAISTIVGLLDALNGKAPLAHTQAIDTITDLQNALAGKLSVAAGAVGTNNLADNAVGANKIASGAVTSAKVTPGHVVGALFTRTGTNQTVPSDTPTLVAWNGYTYNPDSSHVAAQPTRMVCKYAGVYTIAAFLTLNGGYLDDNYQMKLLKNGATLVYVYENIRREVELYIQLRLYIDCVALAVNDYLEIQVSHNVGSDRSVQATLFPPSFSMRRNMF